MRYQATTNTKQLASRGLHDLGVAKTEVVKIYRIFSLLG